MQKRPPSLLIIDDELPYLEALQKVFNEKGFRIRIAETGEEGIQMFQEETADLVITDLGLPGISGIDVLKQIKNIDLNTDVILITGIGTIDSAVEAMKIGAHDYITKPFKPDEIIMAVRDALKKRELRLEMAHFDEAKRRASLESILGSSTPMQKVYWLIERVAPSTGNVLVIGESGTGKELAARAIHALSPRKNEPFIPVSCGALTETLLESELFGHIKGSFTGATSTKYGLFEVAENGTIFLDEIGEISPAIQVKLLRVLQEREIKRVGSVKTLKVNVRVIAATNKNLLTAIQNNQFRKDLYYRLNVITIEIPPLRERKEDIPQLAYHFLEKYTAEVGKEIVDIDSKTLKILQRYHWPGNVRELENVIERAVILTQDKKITPRDLPDVLVQQGLAPPPPSEIKTIEEMEKEHIKRVLERVGNNKAEASRILGINRATLYRKIKRYDLEKEESKE